MCTELDINAEYVVIRCDRQHAMALKMELDVEAPNLIGVSPLCAAPHSHHPNAMSFETLAIGDRLQVKRIESVQERGIIPLDDRSNAVQWRTSGPPRHQAVITEAYIKKKNDRIEKLAYTRMMNRGKRESRRRFFDSFEGRERNLPTSIEPSAATLHGLALVAFVQMPAGTRMHPQNKCFVPPDYAGEVNHCVVAESPVYVPVSYVLMTKAEETEFSKQLNEQSAATKNAACTDLLVAASTLKKCCADKEGRQGYQPNMLEPGKRWRLVQKHAYADIHMPKYEMLKNLLEASFSLLTRPAKVPEGSLVVLEAGRVIGLQNEISGVKTADANECKATRPHDGIIQLATCPKICFINLDVPEENKRYASAQKCGMLEIRVRRKRLPDQRILFKRKGAFRKLRHTYALLLGYPLKKLKLHTWGRYLLDTETPECTGLDNGEIVEVEMDALAEVHEDTIHVMEIV